MISSTRARRRPSQPCANALRNVEELARFDTKYAEAAQQLISARAIVDDVSDSLRDYAARINASPDRLAEIEDRLVVISRLKRKYGSTVAEVIAFGADVAARLAEVEDRETILSDTRAAMLDARAKYAAAAQALSASRSAAAGKLAKQAETRSTSSP